MEEGERLSKKQLAQESTIKKLRTQAKELGAEKGKLAADLAAERQALQAAKRQKQELDTSFAVSAPAPSLHLGWQASAPCAYLPLIYQLGMRKNCRFYFCWPAPGTA